MAIAAHKRLKPEQHEITITRIVDGAPDKVFEAWLEPDHLSQWWGAREGRTDFTTPHVKVDPRKGGTFRTCIRSPQGEDYWARGVYMEIDPPRHLAFSHGWEDDEGETGQKRLVTVDFTESGGRTRVEFRIAGFESSASRDSEIEGWNECLDRLVRYFAERQRTS